MVINPGDAKTVEALLQIIAHPKETQKHLDALKQQNDALAKQQAELSEKLRRLESLADAEKREAAIQARESALQLEKARHQAEVDGHRRAVAAHAAAVEAKRREQLEYQDALEKRGADFRSQQILAERQAKELRERQQQLADSEAAHADRVRQLKAIVG